MIRLTIQKNDITYGMTWYIHIPKCNAAKVWKLSTCNFCLVVALLASRPTTNFEQPMPMTECNTYPKQAEFEFKPSAKLKKSETIFAHKSPNGNSINNYAYSKNKVIFSFILPLQLKYTIFL